MEDNKIYFRDFLTFKGRQAIVRLMLLGGHQYVAVKAINMNKKNRFYEEAEIWKKLRTTSFNSKRSIPKLFGTEVVTTKDGKKFGIIVTELGVPVNAIFKNLDEPKTRLVKEDQFESFFKSFRKTAYYTGTIKFKISKFDALVCTRKKEVGEL